MKQIFKHEGINDLGWKSLTGRIFCDREIHMETVLWKTDQKSVVQNKGQKKSSLSTKNSPKSDQAQEALPTPLDLKLSFKESNQSASVLFVLRLYLIAK